MLICKAFNREDESFGITVWLLSIFVGPILGLLLMGFFDFKSLWLVLVGVLLSVAIIGLCLNDKKPN